MLHRIIAKHGCKTCNQVLIFLDRNEIGENFVRILAWHYYEEAYYIQSAEADVYNSEDDLLMMQRYIADFSEVSANEFANSMKFD